MSEVLKLNSAFLPLDVISVTDAITMLYQSKAFTVIETDKVMRSPSITMKVPSVISVINYHRTPKRKVGYSDLNVIYRDDMVCQYCGKRFEMTDLNIDHVIPKSRWQVIKRTSKRDWTNFLNCVCSCKWCNNKKGNMLLQEAKMKLIRKPFVPTYLPYIVVKHSVAKEKGWLPFSKYNMRFTHMPL